MTLFFKVLSSAQKNSNMSTRQNFYVIADLDDFFRGMNILFTQGLACSSPAWITSKNKYAGFKQQKEF